MSDVLTLSPNYYEALKRLTLELVGIKLGGNHAFLIETRLAALARKEGYENLNQMVEELFARGETRLAIHVVSALLERAHSFFEDTKSFEALTDIVLPRLYPLFKDEGLKILSYACSSGQEIYSTAILLDKLKGEFPRIDIKLFAADYPSRALDRAKQGRFTHFEVQRGLPARDLVAYFTRDGEDWLVKPELKNKIKFIEHNLLGNIEDLGTYQIVLFRGQLQQFAPPAKIRILRMLGKIITAGGALVLGSNESLGDMNLGFDKNPVAPGSYVKLPKADTLPQHNDLPKTG